MYSATTVDNMTGLLGRLLAGVLLWLATLSPAHAAVTVTFWSHEFGNSFPHTFVTLRGTLDADGAPVDLNYGFTARSVSPAILFGKVAGRIDVADVKYITSSDAQFSLVISDAQYADLRRLADEWDAVKGNATYRLNARNCVHFVKEAARRVGLTTLDFPKLMKKPRSYLKAVAAANAARVTVLDQPGATYLASLPPITAAPRAMILPPSQQPSRVR